MSGKVSDERFEKLSREYDLEQDSLKSEAEILRQELKQQEQKQLNAKSFIAITKKYTYITELDATILREFIQRIEVSHTYRKAEAKNITIVYNFIGAFNFTAKEPVTDNQATRKIGIA